MDKTKKIIISLAISFVVLVTLNFIVIHYTSSDYITVAVFKTSMLKGKKVGEKDINTIQIKRTDINKQFFEEIDISTIVGKILTQDVEKGQLVLKDQFVIEEDMLEEDINYQYISIPVSNLSYPTCSKLKRGDAVTVYYTGKNKDVSNAIKDKKRLYSNTSQEGLVTCLLFETVEVISVHDSTGKETKENVVTDILIRLKREDAILVANLKSQGTFDIVLN